MDKYLGYLMASTVVVFFTPLFLIVAVWNVFTKDIPTVWKNATDKLDGR